MQLVVPVHRERVSPLLDEARRVLLLEIDAGRELRRSELRLEDTEPLARARVITELRPRFLICGAVSRAFEAVLVSAGIQVYANTCGPVEEVISAFMTGRLTEDAFLLPGCTRRRLRSRGRGGRG